MGSTPSALTSEEVEDFTELTYFSKQEVLYHFTRFRKLDPERVDIEPLETRIPFETLKTLPELQYNPFADRLISVFSSREDGRLGFEDFLDLASVMSEYAPAQLKADWAFKIFDFDGDDAIGAEDIEKVLGRLTTPLSTNDNIDEEILTKAELDTIIKFVLSEADLNKSGTITAQEFRHIMTKSPDFAHNFRIRL